MIPIAAIDINSLLQFIGAAIAVAIAVVFVVRRMLRRRNSPGDADSRCADCDLLQYCKKPGRSVGSCSAGTPHHGDSRR